MDCNSLWNGGAKGTAVSSTYGEPRAGRLPDSRPEQIRLALCFDSAPKTAIGHYGYLEVPNQRGSKTVLKKILIVLAALVVLGMVFGEDDETLESIGDNAAAGAAEVSENPTPTEKAAEAAERQEVEDDHAEEPAPVEKKRAPTYLVTRVVDGDTIELGNGESVRLVGIDTPERGECGYDQATANMERLVLAKRVRLGVSDEDRDKYDRLLRYVNVGSKDAGLRQVARGFAIARYDSRDGYGYHQRENKYIATDKASPDFKCVKPKPKPQPLVPAPAPAPQGNCASGYSPCIPPYPPDLDCADVPGPIYVTGSDPHGLDADGDGVACE